MRRIHQSGLQAIFLVVVSVVLTWQYLHRHPDFYQDKIKPHIPMAAPWHSGQIYHVSEPVSPEQEFSSEQESGISPMDSSEYDSTSNAQEDDNEPTSVEEQVEVDNGNWEAAGEEVSYEGNSTLETMEPDELVPTTPEETSPQAHTNGEPDANQTHDDNVSTIISNKPSTSLEEEKDDSTLKPSKYVEAIMNPEDSSISKLNCSAPDSDRYDYLKWTDDTPIDVSQSRNNRKPRYFIAMDLYECLGILPRLMSTVVELVKWLGPENCAISVVEGRGADGTYEVLAMLKKEFEALGTSYSLSSNEVHPKANQAHRLTSLAALRNQALEPLVNYPDKYDSDTTVIFINDVSLCLEDVLELIHQYSSQKMDMACAMDWVDNGRNFSDVWVSRTMQGDVFLENPQDSRSYGKNLFASDLATRKRFEAKQPFQVYACWNGVSVLRGRPFLKNEIRFRKNNEKTGECFMGEPTLLCKDFWRKGLYKIAVVPSVNVGYNDSETRQSKEKQGTVRSNLELANAKRSEVIERIKWQSEPPQLVKCLSKPSSPVWVDALWP